MPSNNYSCSIVTYNHSLTQISRVIKCIIKEKGVSDIYIIDHSKNTELSTIANLDKRIYYYSNPLNPGFGSGHNFAVNIAEERLIKFHFIVNPDIFFDPGVMDTMSNFMSSKDNVGLLMPKLLYPDGSIQFLPKFLPNILLILFRKLFISKYIFKNIIEEYELRNYVSDAPIDVPTISGCFCLINIPIFKEFNGFDESYFMYFEDWDISRKINKKYYTIYYPAVSVYHEYERGANKNFKLFYHFICSMVRYFNHWGWFDSSVEKDKRDFS
jgi:GT2 family glycosyltransferase